MIDPLVKFLECWNLLPDRVRAIMADEIRQMSQMYPEDARQLEEFVGQLSPTNSQAAVLMLIQWRELLRSRRWREQFEREQSDIE